MTEESQRFAEAEQESGMSLCQALEREAWHLFYPFDKEKKKKDKAGILPLACTFLLRLSSSLKSLRAQYVGLKVKSFGE